MEYSLINPVNPMYTNLEQVLVNRGIPYKDIPHYLHVTKEDNLSPLFFNNIKEAAIMLIKHIGMSGNIIKVQVDGENCPH